MTIKTVSNKAILVGDIIRSVGGKQRYVAVVSDGRHVVLARHVEIVDGKDWIHAYETDPVNDPKKILGEA